MKVKLILEDRNINAAVIALINMYYIYIKIKSINSMIMIIDNDLIIMIMISL